MYLVLTKDDIEEAIARDVAGIGLFPVDAKLEAILSIDPGGDPICEVFMKAEPHE